MPWKAIGGDHCCHGGPVEESQRVLAECCEEYDAAVDAGQGAVLHRIAHRIFRPSSSSRVDINRFVEDGGCFEESPFAHACLQDYALVLLVDWAVESLHARIKRIGKGCTYVLPPSKCAMLRHSQTLELLRSNQDFYWMCVRVCDSRTSLKDLLALGQSGALHVRSKRLDWIKCVYQLILADQFEDLSEPV